MGHHALLGTEAPPETSARPGLLRRQAARPAAAAQGRLWESARRVKRGQGRQGDCFMTAVTAGRPLSVGHAMRAVHCLPEEL